MIMVAEPRLLVAAFANMRCNNHRKYRAFGLRILGYLRCLR